MNGTTGEAEAAANACLRGCKLLLICPLSAVSNAAALKSAGHKQLIRL